MSTFYVPDLGEGLTEAQIVRWLVSEGDTVAVDQPVVEVETAKSVVELPVPFAGRVTELHGADGDTLSVGSALISVEDASGIEEYRREEQAGSGNVLVGYGTTATAPPRRQRTRAAAQDSSGPLRVSSPLVRKIAREGGVDLHALRGSGPEGMIMRSDVREAINSPQDASQAPVGNVRDGLTRTTMNAVDKAMAETLGRSRGEIPEATVWVDVDFTELFDVRDRADPPISLLGYLARFTVAALRQYPQLNGQVDEQRFERVAFDQVHLSIAVHTERGLITPAVRNAHTMTTRELDAAISHLVDTARSGGVGSPGPGTFTLNNYGTFNVDGSAAIINHPQVAILGFGRIIDRPWAVGGELTIRKIGQMSFVFDHRVCDGGVAAGFMRTIADAIENPAAAIAGL